MSVVLFAAGFVAGAGCWWAVAAVRRRSTVSEAALVAYSNRLDDVERLWKPAGVGVGYSIDYGTGEVDLTIRAPNCGEDVAFHLATPNVTRRKRGVAETLGISTEVPPSLR
jgi:hypothetical protein